MPAQHLTEALKSGSFTLHLTPAEWRDVLKDGSFLDHADNCCRPRRLMGLPVQIVPDHAVVHG